MVENKRGFAWQATLGGQIRWSMIVAFSSVIYSLYIVKHTNFTQTNTFRHFSLFTFEAVCYLVFLYFSSIPFKYRLIKFPSIQSISTIFVNYLV